MEIDPSMTTGLQSLNLALDVLGYLQNADGAVSLSDVARDLGMPPSKVHRYLASFLQAGLVQQDGRNGLYDLGQGALRLGLAALARYDFVNRAADGLPALARSTGTTALLSVWGNQGATIIRWERGPAPVNTSFGLGTTLPLLTTATGRAFLAHLPKHITETQRSAEARRIARNPALSKDVPFAKTAIDAMVDDVRSTGFSSVDGQYIPGLAAIAAPILDWQNEAQAVVSLIGTDPNLIPLQSTQVEELLAFCKANSIVS